MKRRSSRKETWEEFEKRVGAKRSGRGKEERPQNVPSDIVVQRMSSTPSGRLKKYEPLDTRDFVPFAEYDEINIENIKEACERYYKAPVGSCDILASDRGPSCSKIEQIKGKKVFFVRFLPPKEDRSPELGGIKRPASVPVVSPTKSLISPKTVFPKSVSVGELLKAGRLIKPPKTTTLELEYFDVERSTWVKGAPINLAIENNKFAAGAFRDAFKAKCSDQSSSYYGDWVVKKYQKQSIETIENDLKMRVEDHTRKQVQMHAVARSITARFSSKVPKEFGQSFEFGKVYYSIWEGQHVTVEKYVPGVFHKYVNNDGQCVASPDEEYDEVYEKAQCLTLYSYLHSNKKLIILDLQGAKYELYDPEIATSELQEEDDTTGELYFCAGNLSIVSIEKFFVEHSCNKFCRMMGLTDE